MSANTNTVENQSWLDRPMLAAAPRISLEVALFVAIILLALASRFYNLGARVMSHDESLHTYYSYLLSQGQGYQHNPMMHGPLQFHMIALVYFLFGADDTTARIPAALFGVLTICMLWKWRKYLGRTGALAAAFMALISPYMLYYARYTRNEAFVGLFGLMMLYAILRYFETGRDRYLYLLTASVVLHFTAKETAFIYTAQALLYLAIYFVIRITRQTWADPFYYRKFLVSLALGLLLVVGGIGFGLVSAGTGAGSAGETAPPAVPTTALSPLAPPQSAPLSPGTIALVLGLVALVAAGFFLVRGYSVAQIRRERSFDMLVLLATLALPQLAPLVGKVVLYLANSFLSTPIAWNPLDYSSRENMIITGALLIGCALVAAVIGWWWNFDVWWKCALMFYAVYVIFFTTLFTNGVGFFTGIIGSLGYWLDQQGVERGSQPWYFYLLVQIPVYEFLPAIASLAALYFTIRQPGPADAPRDNSRSLQSFDVPLLLGFWTVTSILAYSMAGEKMPWLTFHMALPMILWGGWGIDRLAASIDWAGLRQRNALLVTTLLTMFLVGALGVIVALLFSPAPPFQGKELSQLGTSGSFILAVALAAGSAWGLYRLRGDWESAHLVRLGGLIGLAILALVTIHSSARAAYVNYDNGEEYLVYAHGYTGVKDVMRQIDVISDRTTGGKNLVIAYDDDVPWPFTWYLRDYHNQKFFGSAPGEDLRDVPAIIVGDNNFAKIEPIVGQAFYRFDYIRMVWPNQDYFGLTWPRIKNAISDPAVRAGLFNIWLNRDYSLYAQAIEPYAIQENAYFDPTSYLPQNWSPSDRMRLYVRKDIAAQIWTYGIGQPSQVQADPYEKGVIKLSADLAFGTSGQEPGQFNTPRGVAAAPDGSLYVADSRNNRIQHFSAEGQFINAWGTFMDATLQAAAPGTFNEPWGVAVGPDGSVYVTDTWNHRIEKFTADGQPIKVWGHYGLADSPDSLWGPRGIAVDSQGHVYVADTGNKRIVVYDSEGNQLAAFGGEGYAPGQFDEPVGVAVDSQGTLYVADTWNQRVQSFTPSADGKTFIPAKQWDISGWFGQSLDNKPFVAADGQGHLFITDPEGFRVLEFTGDGQFVQTWGEYGSDTSQFGLASGIAVDAAGHVWVSDSNNHRVMRFTIP